MPRSNQDSPFYRSASRPGNAPGAALRALFNSQGRDQNRRQIRRVTVWRSLRTSDPLPSSRDAQTARPGWPDDSFGTHSQIQFPSRGVCVWALANERGTRALRIVGRTPLGRRGDAGVPPPRAATPHAVQAGVVEPVQIRRILCRRGQGVPEYLFPGDTQGDGSRASSRSNAPSPASSRCSLTPLSLSTSHPVAFRGALR